MSGRIQPTSFGYTLANLGSSMYAPANRARIYMYQDWWIRRVVLGVCRSSGLTVSRVLIKKSAHHLGICILYHAGSPCAPAVLSRLQYIIGHIYPQYTYSITGRYIPNTRDIGNALEVIKSKISRMPQRPYVLRHRLKQGRRDERA